MKFILIATMTLMSTFCFSTEHAVTIPNQKDFDAYWKLVDENINDDEAFQEWVPTQETAENWTKSFGIQRYQLKQDYDLNHFYKLFVETLSQDFQGQKELFNHEIITQDDNHLIFNWWTTNSDYEIGREWVHLLKEDNHKIIFVRFATKSTELSEEDNLWRDCIFDVAYSDMEPLSANSSE